MPCSDFSFSIERSCIDVPITYRDYSPMSYFNVDPLRRCGYDQLPGVSDHPLDGVLGLGKGKSSIVSQLSDQRVVKNVVGQCLSGKGGYLFLGEDVYDSSRITWTPMSRDHTYSSLPFHPSLPPPTHTHVHRYACDILFFFCTVWK